MDFLLFICLILVGPFLGMFLVNYSLFIEYKTKTKNKAVLFLLLFILTIFTIFYLLFNFYKHKCQ